MNRVFALSLLSLLFVPGILEAGKIRDRDRDRCCQEVTDPAQLAAPLSEQEIANLLFMREEEKLAHDLYLSFFDTWGVKVFEKITAAESKHMAATLRAIQKFGLDDPAAGNPIGVFTNPDLQQLYSDLFLAGRLSALEALEVGALVEEKLIIDLRAAIAMTDNKGLDRMYGNCLTAAGKHLRTYVRHLVKSGIVYEPQLLTQKVFDEIVGAG